MARAQKPGTGATNKRRKELAAAKAERQSARRAQEAAVRRRRLVIGWSAFAVVAAAAVAIVVMWPLSGSDSTATPTPSATPTANVDIGCEPAPLPSSEAPQSWKVAPELQLADDTDYTLTLATNCGSIVIAADSQAAPTTVNNMLWLAQQEFFDSTPCPRVTTEGFYVLQCGDPLGNGGGNAGYTIPDENLPEAGDNNYPRGTVAMANGGPNTGSSQFFIVYQDSTLPPSYSIWGKVTEGLDVVERVAAAGVVGGGPDGEPAGSIGIVTAVPDPRLG